MKMLNRFLFLLIIFLPIISSNAYSEQSAYERANAAAWKAIEAKEAMSGGVEEKNAESIKAKIKAFIDAGSFVAEKKVASETANTAIDASLRAMNLEPAANRSDAINRLMTPGRFYVFISNSMPKGQITSLLKSLQKTPYNVEVAYRGLFEGNRTIVDFTKQASQQLRDMGIKEMDAMIGMNPTAFREFAVTKVPTLAYVHEDKTVSKITGIINLDLFQSQLIETGVDLGNDGSTFEIAEKDFFLEIQERIAKIDWDKKAKEVEQKYWDSHKPHNFPVSYESSSHNVDMTVVVTDNIYAEYDGKKHVIARAGDKFNPMIQSKFNQFNRRILILDPNDFRQVEWAREQVLTALSSNERPVVMLTSLLSTKKKETFHELEKTLKVQIFLLQDAVSDRFNVNRIPSMIRKSDDHEGFMQVNYYSCRENGCYE